MIRQYRLQLSLQNGERIPSFWAYRLYAWLLTQMPPDMAEQIHEQEKRVISQYVDQGIWVVNLLDEHIITALATALEDTKEIILHEDTAAVMDCQQTTIESAGIFLEQGRRMDQRRAELQICSPAAFKQDGRYTIFPKEELILQSLLMRWNELYPEYLLEDADMVEELKHGIHIVDYNLRSGRFRLKNTAIPCFYGKVFLESRLPIVLQELWNTLLCFAPYTGIGIKTTLGMGGVKLSI